MSNNSAVVINDDYLDWIRRNPVQFVNRLVSRLEQGEVDPYPGFARWNGDAMPGVQVAFIGHSSFPGVVLVGGHGCGKKLMTMPHVDRNANPPNDVEVLKAMAERLGYSIRKKPSSRKNKKKIKKSRRKF